MSKLAEALAAWQAKFPDKAEAPLKVTDAICPPALRMGQDQYRCTKCGMVWDIDEDRPTCNNFDSNPRDNPNEAF